MKATTSDYFRVIFVLIGSIIQILAGGLPNILGWQYTIGSRSNEVQTLIVPASYAFVIWSIIFLGCLIYAVVQLFPVNRTNPSFRKVGWLAGIAFWFNTIWEVYVPIRSMDWGSLLLILIILCAALSILFILQSLNDQRIIFLPLFLLAGWVSVATFVNFSVTTNFMEFNPFNLSEHLQVAILIIAAGLVTGFFALQFGSLAYNLAVTWGFIAIYVINIARAENQIAYLALGFGILGIALVLLQKLKPVRVLQWN